MPNGSWHFSTSKKQHGIFVSGSRRQIGASWVRDLTRKMEPGTLHHAIDAATTVSPEGGVLAGQLAATGESVVHDLLDAFRDRAARGPASSGFLEFDRLAKKEPKTGSPVSLVVGSTDAAQRRSGEVSS